MPQRILQEFSSPVRRLNSFARNKWQKILKKISDDAESSKKNWLGSLVMTFDAAKMKDISYFSGYYILFFGKVDDDDQERCRKGARNVMLSHNLYSRDLFFYTSTITFLMKNYAFLGC